MHEDVNWALPSTGRGEGKTYRGGDSEDGVFKEQDRATLSDSYLGGGSYRFYSGKMRGSLDGIA